MWTGLIILFFVPIFVLALLSLKDFLLFLDIEVSFALIVLSLLSD